MHAALVYIEIRTFFFILWLTGGMNVQEFTWHTCQLQNAVTVSGLHTAFIETFEPSFAGHMEKHNFWELVAVLDGEVCVETEGQTVCLKNGQMILHPPLEMHRHFNCSMTRNTFAVLSFDAIIALKEAAGIYHLNMEQKQQICRLIRRIRQIYEIHENRTVFRLKSNDLAVQQNLKSQLELMLLSILGCEAQLARDNPEYSRIMTVLQERIADNLSCCELAQELGMSQSNLKRVFSSYSRVGIMHYYRHLRTEYAAVLLKEGLSVHAVSERLNYSSQSAFCNSFKRMCGILPSDVRLIKLKSTENY